MGLARRPRSQMRKSGKYSKTFFAQKPACAPSLLTGKLAKNFSGELVKARLQALRFL